MREARGLDASFGASDEAVGAIGAGEVETDAGCGRVRAAASRPRSTASAVASEEHGAEEQYARRGSEGTHHVQ